MAYPAQKRFDSFKHKLIIAVLGLSAITLTLPAFAQTPEERLDRIIADATALKAELKPHVHTMLPYIDNVVGLNTWSFGAIAADTISCNVSQVSPLNDKMFLRSFRPFAFSNSGFANKPASLLLGVLSGSTVSGTIDFGRVGAFKV